MKEERRRRKKKKKNNAKFSGHYVLTHTHNACAHTLRSERHLHHRLLNSGDRYEEDLKIRIWKTTSTQVQFVLNIFLVKLILGDVLIVCLLA